MLSGQRVRIKKDPFRTGTLTDKSIKLGTRNKRGVDFDNGGIEYVLEGSIELIPEAIGTPSSNGTIEFTGRKALRRSITFRRLSGRLGNVIYSMESTDTDFLPYQFKPVLSLLDSPSRGLLIADEVGLGKTIEAGLIWTELRSRLDCDKLLVICPAMLREKWVRELRRRFGVSAEITDAKGVLEAVNEQAAGNRSGFALVCSKDGLRPPSGYKQDDTPTSTRGKLAKLLSDKATDEPIFDLVVIDEAHYMRNSESLTSELGRLIRPVCDYLVLLSATPIQLDSQDLFQLLRIIDPHTFAFEGAFRQILRANEPVNRLRDYLQQGGITNEEFDELIKKALSHPLLAGNRQLEYLRQATQDLNLNDPTNRTEISADLANVNLLNRTISRTRKSEVTELRVVRQAVPEFIEMSAPEREFYQGITEAVQKYCKRQNIGDGFLLAMPQRQLSSSLPAAFRSWAKHYLPEAPDELQLDSVAEELSYEIRTEQTSPLITYLSRRAAELSTYDILLKNDTKYARLQLVLKQYFNAYPSEKVLVFSYFRETVSYLSERLEQADIPSLKLMGGMKQNKDEIVAQFSEDPTVRVLIATEVASEGVDLQFCRVVCNYDLPWNPMKVEQRIGRIDRIGQKAEKISIWNLLYEETVDARIYKRLLERLKVFEFALGGLEAVLGDQITKLTNDLLSGRLSRDQQNERIQQTEQAIANLARENRDLEDKAGNLIAHSDYILNEVRAAKSLQRFLNGEELAAYFLEFFRTSYPETRTLELEEAPLTYEIDLDNDARHDLSEFISQKRIRTRTFLIHRTESPVRFIFDNKKKVVTGLNEVIDQFHPAIQFINHKLKYQHEHEVPCAIRVLRVEVGDIEPASYAFTVQRWEMTGVRRTEQLAFCAVNLSTGRYLDIEAAELLVNHAARSGTDWNAARSKVAKDKVEHAWEACDATLESSYEKQVERLARENADRADVLQQTSESHFRGQIAELQAMIERMEREGRIRIIPATRGKIRKLEQRMQERLASLNQGRTIRPMNSQVAHGVIEVH